MPGSFIAMEINLSLLPTTTLFQLSTLNSQLFPVGRFFFFRLLEKDTNCTNWHEGDPLPLALSPSEGEREFFLCGWVTQGGALRADPGLLSQTPAGFLRRSESLLSIDAAGLSGVSSFVHEAATLWVMDISHYFRQQRY